MLTYLLLLILSAICAEANPINYTAEDPPAALISVWTGQNLSLSCEDNKDLAFNHRLWRKGSQLLSASTVIISLDTRFSVINEHVLILNNVTRYDEGEYSCEIVKHPPLIKKYSVSVDEVYCGAPEYVLNGYLDPDPRNVDTFRYGDVVKYSCQMGYILVGEPVRICHHPVEGWLGDAPMCELKEVAEVNTRMGKLENKLNRFLNSDLDIFHKVEQKFSDLEGRVKTLEGDTSIVTLNRNKNDLMEREVHHLKKALSLNAIRTPWETFLSTNVAQMGVRDGHMVSEYSWFVPDFDAKMKQYRDMNFDYIESKSFYTHIPGYHMVLHVYPNYDQTDYVGFFAILLQGRFDDIVAWPFTSKYVLSIATVNSEKSDVFDIIVPVRAAECKFERPPPDNNIGCGFASFLQHTVLHEKAALHKTNGGVLFRMSVFLDD